MLNGSQVWVGHGSAVFRCLYLLDLFRVLFNETRLHNLQNRQLRICNFLFLFHCRHPTIRLFLFSREPVQQQFTITFDMWGFAFCACIWPPEFFSVSLSDLQDFRDAVSQASRQSGKPVIEERLLNQILYSLPQLYELNQDLLRELNQRVANWYDTIMYFNMCVLINMTDSKCAPLLYGRMYVRAPATTYVHAFGLGLFSMDLAENWLKTFLAPAKRRLLAQS